ncbi:MULTISPECIES: glutamine synthetase family protein [Mycobacterium]|uniref:Glutamine synthetase n=1 Tax=Mycobacterium kiyosense TaxID=2871094 RepID=A0A9P3UYF9_9MYCO|nr:MULTISPECIES: glutamine synthetase family protein [Mycobacterium]BDB43527.1 glutamine synthetase [Mycobacterium kiyosense]BDE13314.1 glutamine synthetase [Mycobacterium sp. 20KCMC460]GLB85958.1 glutamine synthetase [Mycobacterium kiyosense]GLB90862.1 glutamine synthetase [Mycobacterium kiyosense]GLB96425.1 glutamine synthetase [Mycobacterium kiyosense]
MLSEAELAALVADGDIDTVIVAFTDMQGRLVGKRVAGRFFVDEVAGHGAECCSYLLAVDVDMNTVPGYAMSSWETGYGDMVMTPDVATLRLVPWLPGTALVIADLSWADGSPVTAAPRAVLRRQLDRLSGRGLVADVATELEFIVFEQSYRQAWADGYRGLTPASDYNIDYAILASTRMEPLLRDIRLGMAGAGLRVEAVKGECNNGQQELGFRYDEALVTCDNHAVYKNGAKEIADRHGKSLTFMAKYDEREGNSCHIHLSLRDAQGPLFAEADAPHGMSALFRHFVAGLLTSLRELTLFYAPNINSYKRFADGSFAPTAVAWGLDNRTCALRVVGHGPGMRVECRVPGGDVNQYLAVAALIAGGLYGIEQGLELGEPYTGNAYQATDVERLPATLGEAAGIFGASELARSAFGDDVVDHYLNNACVEVAAFNAAVTDWERKRGFERL